jgi:hypothetical protein
MEAAVEKELEEFRQMVADRPLDEFYLGELEDRQNYEAL